MQMNLGGAKDRPVLEHVWVYVQARLNGDKNAKKTCRLTSFVSMVTSKIFR